MLSRFFGKRDKSDDSPTQEAKVTRGIEVIEDDPDTAWGMWDSAVADQQTPPVAESTPAPQPGTPKAAPQAGAPAQASAASAMADAPTKPIPLEEMTLEQRKEAALAVVELHHKRIANTIRTLWGYKECSVYINKLIMSGGDGMGHARVGFNQEAVQAMLALSDLHDSEFGPPDTPSGGLGLSI
jgi:hypothetical protein